MKIFAVIAEFNPFHNGHAYLIDQIKQHYDNALCVAIMSGSFTQRGEVGIFDKWQRAQLAVRGGVDLVLELPTVFAVRSAEGFARGAVSLLSRLHCIDILCFGSEICDMHLLQKAAHILNTQVDSLTVRTKLKNGIPYAAAIQEILTTHLPQASSLLNKPNTILAIEYLKAMQNLQADFIPISIKRQGAAHANINFSGTYSSSSSIRRILRHNHELSKIISSIPTACQDYLKDICANSNSLANNENLSRVLDFKLRTSSRAALCQFVGVHDGLDYALLHAAVKSTNFSEILHTLKNRYYHYSRLQRTLVHILLGLTASSLATFDEVGPSYVRVLAFNQNGQKILKKMKTSSTIPLVSKITNFISQKQFWNRKGTALQQMLYYDLLSTDIQALSYQHPKTAGRDFTISPFYYQI